MCGFVGFVNQKDNGQQYIKKMNDLIAHRGPDSEGFFHDEFMHMGFRRLKIIDLETGDQPIYNETNSKVILFNGEIYNYQELRRDLIEKGHIFKTKTDTEVILHGYEEYGERILDKLRGMYAFVIWDLVSKELFAARDIFGIKPFYYAYMNDTFFFGSEIKSFLVHPDFHKELNAPLLKTFLTFQYNPMSETFFKGVFKLLPGHCLHFRNGQLRITKYYTFSFAPQKGNKEKMVHDLQKELISSVKSHEISDVEIGSFLSSGLDSSYLTALSHPKKTFTVGFDKMGFNEIKAAQEFSELIKSENVSSMITQDEFMKMISKVQYYSDEPHANLSCVPLFLLSELAKKDVNVVISGEGADELFGGYQTYWESAIERKYRKLPVKWKKLNKKMASILPSCKLKSLFLKCGTDISETYIGQACVFSDDEANLILKKEYQTDVKAKDITKPYFDQVKGLDDITRKQYVDLFLWLPNDILLKADKMTMANSLELRVPYLDKHVFAFAKMIPENLKYHKKESKYLLRLASSPYVPKIWEKREKIGFLVPFREYLKKEECFLEIKSMFETAAAHQFFDVDGLHQLLDQFLRGEMVHRKIYTIYCFLVWYHLYFEDEKKA